MKTLTTIPLADTNAIRLWGLKALATGTLLLSSFMGFGQYNSVGDATSITQGNGCGAGDCFELTADANGEAGAVWSNTQMDLDQPFEVCFSMNFGNSDNGGDGMAFVLHTDTDGNTALGGGGGDIGYGGNPGIEPSVAIEFDTWDNWGDPGNSDHISLVTDGDRTNALATEDADPNGGNIEDGNCHDICITWDPATNTLQVTFDGNVRMTQVLDMRTTVFGGNNTVTWGFTGATGAWTNQQIVCIESMTNEEEGPCCDTDCPNLTTNGNFGGPCGTGYTSTMTNRCAGGWSFLFDGQFGEVTDASTINSAWHATDHSGDGSSVMIIDGPSAAGSDQTAWSQNVTLEVGKEYCFTAWVRNIYDGSNGNGSDPTFGLEVDGVQLTSRTLAFADGWVQLCVTFTATQANTTISIGIPAVGGGVGNDAAIDDIELRALDCDDCCDDFHFLVATGCTGAALAWYSGNELPCGNATVFMTGFNSVQIQGTGLLGHYNLQPGQSQFVSAGLIDGNGDTICFKSATVHCPLGVIACDGLWVDRKADQVTSNLYHLSLVQNPFIVTPIYAVRVDGIITADGFGIPLILPAPGSPGLSIGSVNSTVSPTPVVEYLNSSYSVICSQTIDLSSVGSPVYRQAHPEGVTEEGTVDQQALNDLTLSPNPANDLVRINFDLQEGATVAVEVISVTGSQAAIQELFILHAGPQQLQLNTSELSNGIYFVRISSGGMQHTERLVIQH